MVLNLQTVICGLRNCCRCSVFIRGVLLSASSSSSASSKSIRRRSCLTSGTCDLLNSLVLVWSWVDKEAVFPPPPPYCSVGGNPTCSVPALYRDARVYRHTTTAMNADEFPPPATSIHASVYVLQRVRFKTAPPPPWGVPISNPYVAKTS